MTKKHPAAVADTVGAFVFSTKPTPCPACGLMIPASTLHRCGNMRPGDAGPIEAFAGAFLGSKGGAAKSAAKTAAARLNQQKGADKAGRPKGAKDTQPRKPRKKAR